MLITRRSPFSGKMNTIDIPVTNEQLENWYHGMMIQHAMPNLTADQLEFIKTGITDEEYPAALIEDEEE